MSLTSEQLGRLLHHTAASRRHGKRYLRDHGLSGTGPELDAQLALARVDAEAVRVAAALDAAAREAAARAERETAANRRLAEIVAVIAGRPRWVATAEHTGGRWTRQCRVGRSKLFDPTEDWQVEVGGATVAEAELHARDRLERAVAAERAAHGHDCPESARFGGDDWWSDVVISVWPTNAAAMLAVLAEDEEAVESRTIRDPYCLIPDALLRLFGLSRAD